MWKSSYWWLSDYKSLSIFPHLKIQLWSGHSMWWHYAPPAGFCSDKEDTHYISNSNNSQVFDPICKIFDARIDTILVHAVIIFHEYSSCFQTTMKDYIFCGKLLFFHIILSTLNHEYLTHYKTLAYEITNFIKNPISAHVCDFLWVLVKYKKKDVRSQKKFSILGHSKLPVL